MSTQDHKEQVPIASIPVGARGRYPRLDGNCVLQVWFYFLGNALIFGAMISKLWRVTRLLVNPQMRDIRVPLLGFLRYVGALVLVHVALLTAWTIMAPPYYRFEVFQRAQDGFETWHGTCELLPEGALPFALSLLGIELVVIQFGIYLCNQSRNVHSRYSEAKSIAFILWEFLQMTSIGLTVGVLVYPFSPSGHPVTFFMVKWLAPASVNITVTALMFVGKVVEWWTSKKRLDMSRLSAAATCPSASSHTKGIHGWGDAGTDELEFCKQHMSVCMTVPAKHKVAPHASVHFSNKSSHQESNRSSVVSHSIGANSTTAPHDQNMVTSLISQLREARAAQLHAEQHLRDASTDLSELRERNMELKERTDTLARNLKEARAEAARG
jgi:hypothetical protein